MVDWYRWVRDRLEDSAVPVRRRDPLAEELAAYLEDCYRSLRREGRNDFEARKATMREVRDWTRFLRKLARFIREDKDEKERIMKQRLFQLWLPGTVVAFLAYLSLAFLERLTGSQVVLLGPGTFLFLSVPWLAGLLLVGAAGAFWSHRAGAPRWARCAVAVFPVVVLFFLFLVALTVSMFVDRNVPLLLKLRSLAAFLVSFVLLPGAALLAGALPFLVANGGRDARQSGRA